MSTILVVDDKAVSREPIAEALRKHGYDAICAANGVQALSLLQEKSADLVLLDVDLPGLDGLAVLRTMRRNPDFRHIPVILLADRAERRIVVKAAERGVQGYFLKSQFSLEELLARVERCLGQVPVLSAMAAPTEVASENCGYAKWRSSIETGATAAPGASQSPKPAAMVKQGRPSQGSTAVSDQVKPLATVRSVSDLAPVITRSELMELVNEGLTLRPLGETVHNVMAVTGSAGCCTDDVAKAVSHDQALCIRLLKLANSSAYARGHLVDSVKDAIRRIGVHEVRSLVMTLGVFEQFEGAAAEHVDPRLFWEHSIACGLTASALSAARQSNKVDDYFLWGMLHDVGRLILLEHVSDQYAGVWDAAEELGLPLEAVEAQMMLLDHCDILERALEHWQFPRDFIAPVVSHHQSVPKIKRLGPEHSEAAASVALANRISHALLIGSSGNDVIYPLDDLVETLKLPPSKIAEIVKAVPDETNHLKYVMLARSNEDARPDFASQVKSRLDVEFRPLCVSAEPDVDAFRMFCERITVGGSGEPPNIGIVYLRKAEEQTVLTAAYDAQEQENGIAMIPVILICKNGRVDHDHAWLRARRHMILTTPVRIPTLLGAVKQLLG